MVDAFPDPFPQPRHLRQWAAMPKVGERIFPYTTDAICAAFIRAGRVLGTVAFSASRICISTTCAEGVSRLFEIGKDIPRAALVSGHRSWSSLQRYAHIRRTGDRYDGWKWKKQLISAA
jgi:hypothetical protein